MAEMTPERIAEIRARFAAYDAYSDVVEALDALARAQQEIADLREALGKIAVHAECGVDEGRCRPLGIIAKAALAQGTPAGKA